MGAQLDRLRYEVFQNLFYSPMDTGFLRSAVATVLTAYGIETYQILRRTYRPFHVATVLTAYGIETSQCQFLMTFEIDVATVLTAYGIETHHNKNLCIII